MSNAIETIFLSLLEEEKLLAAKVVELKLAEDDLTRVRAAIKALDGKVSFTVEDEYAKLVSWPEKIKYILKIKNKATIADIVNFILTREPNLSEEELKNTITSTAWRLSTKTEEIKVRSLDGKNQYYL